MKAALLLLAAGLVLSPIGYAQPIKVQVIAVDSVDELKRWLGPSVDAARAASYPARLTQLPLGRKTHLPILVSGLTPPAAQETRYVADVEILGTDGRPLGASPRCCEAIVPRGSSARAALLDSTVIVEPEKGRARGSFTVRVSVTDGSQTWSTTEVLPYGESPEVPGSHEVPRLRQNLPASQSEPGGPGDKRDCLGLPTPAEVIRCSEKKK